MPTISLPAPDKEQNSETILSSFAKNIETWQKRIDSLKQEKERENSPNVKEEIAELDHLVTFLKGRMTKRLLAIKQYPEALRKKYLRCLEPFYTEEGITRFMSHYFDVEVFKQVRLRFRKKKDFEKEVNVLFDLYRVKKTIETITTLEKSVISDEPFPSQFEKSEQAEFLKVLKEIFKLFFLRFVKKEYRKELYDALSESNLDMDSIIAMRKSGTSYITPETLQGNEYRDKFITVFFSTLLRTKTSTEIKDLHFNYLNFELLKNEFLTDWMQRKLKTSPEKDKVLQNYQVNGKSVSQLIRENPDQETEILSSIPLDVFNDIAEAVNETVKDDKKTPVTTFSKNHGLFARLQESFNAVKQVAKYSVEKMEEMKPKGKIWTVKKKAGAAANKPLPAKKEEQGQAPTRKEPKKELKISYGLEVLKADDLDFPFFDKRQETYKPKLDFLVKKVGTDYEKFKTKIWKLFNLVAQQHFIIRKEPCHEWVIPFLFSHGKMQLLLIIGAEISQADQTSGYKSKWAESRHQFNGYYLLATQNRNDKFGKVTDIRTVKNVHFHLYSYAEKTVQNMSFSLLNRLFQTRNENVFQSSNLVIRNPTEPFAELSELKELLGWDEQKKPATVVDEDAQVEDKSPPNNAESPDEKTKEKPVGNETQNVAPNPKQELIEEKIEPAESREKKTDAEIRQNGGVTATAKKEPEEEKTKVSTSSSRGAEQKTSPTIEPPQKATTEPQPKTKNN